MEGITECSVNFVNKTLTLEAVQDGTDIVSVVKKRVKMIEPNISPIEKGNHSNHDHDHGSKNVKKTVSRLITGTLLAAIGMFAPISGLMELGIFIIAYLVIGGDIVLRAARNIVRGQVFDENFLMAIATIGAFAIQQYPEGVAVMLFYQVGELFQGIAVNRSRKSISALMDIRPDAANVKRNGNIITVAPEEVKVGDIIIIKPGEKVPLDGKIIEGISMVDTSA